MSAAQLHDETGGSHEELIAVIGEAATIALAEEFGGTRLYIPSRMRFDHPISRAIGHETSQVLCNRYSPATIRVPLARALRAKHYRANGLSNAKIASRLGLTEGGIAALFKRLERRG